MLGFKRFIAIGFLAISTAWADKPFEYQIDAEAQRQAEKTAEIARKNVDSGVLNDVKAVMKTVHSPEYQARIESFKSSLSQAMGAQFSPAGMNETTDSNDKESAPETVNGRVYVFVSSAMPKSVLRKKIREVAKLSNTVVVLNGFIGGAKKVKPTIEFIANILKKDSACQGPQCDLYAVEVNIDPIRFTRYGINRVPAVVYEPDEKFMGYCGGDALKTRSDRLIVYGESSLQYALEMMQEEQPSKGLPELIAQLEPIPWENRDHTGQ